MRLASILNSYLYLNIFIEYRFQLMINFCKRPTDDYGLSVCVYCIFMNLQHITFTMVAKR